MSERVGYLGPPGTFTEEALLNLKLPAETRYVPLQTIPDVLQAVAEHQIDRGIVPVENSIEGTVNATTDMLVFEVELKIESEVVLPVDHNLLVRPGVTLADVEGIYSIPHATAQCRRFLSRYLPGVGLTPTNSTADAARLIASEHPRGAAVATKLAAELYGLSVLAPDIQDETENSTRFIMVGRNGTRPTGNDKTSIVCFIQLDRPGSLLGILQEFASRSINLTKVESRPTKQRLGEYCFLIDLEGHMLDPHVAAALDALDQSLPQVKRLGSYPAWTGTVRSS